MPKNMLDRRPVPPIYQSTKIVHSVEYTYSKTAFLGLFKTIQISRMITLKECLLREVLLYFENNLSYLETRSKKSVEVYIGRNLDPIDTATKLLWNTMEFKILVFHPLITLTVTGCSNSKTDNYVAGAILL
jgi:hypothetical protein